MVSACLVALAGLFGVVVGVILVHMNFNRRKILLCSALGTAIAFASLGTYYMTANTGSAGKIFTFYWSILIL